VVGQPSRAEHGVRTCSCTVLSAAAKKDGEQVVRLLGEFIRHAPPQHADSVTVVLPPF
jgi:hypothetical protein